MSDLKPCPFCGGEARFEQSQCGATDKSSVSIRFSVRCKKCHSTASSAYGEICMNLSSTGELNIWHNDLEKVAEAWNRRAE